MVCFLNSTFLSYVMLCSLSLSLYLLSQVDIRMLLFFCVLLQCPKRWKIHKQWVQWCVSCYSSASNPIRRLYSSSETFSLLWRWSTKSHTSYLTISFCSCIYQKEEVSAVKYIPYEEYRNLLAKEDPAYVPYDVNGDYGKLFEIIRQRYIISYSLLR